MTDALATIFVLEGADGTGKTTFIENRIRADVLAGLPEPRFIHNTSADKDLPGSLFKHYRAQLLDAVEFRANGISTYIDRGFLSELIYGRLYRGKALLTERQVRTLERLAVEADIVLLGLTADLSIRRDRILARGESWDNKQAFVGAFYSQHFRERGKFWITADSSSAPSSN
ncbi:thymidylate kinase [Microbacterium phage Eden]|uniref:Thymidylate kinase n=1 Tax=Microbacterium phage Eden TaxID=2250289 RepID=A0A345KWC2_9CAUD|nr:thymidylate kinase [Microbacterium phage Eden]AXH47324.1 thymidylate kinase [Microbacterium phage Eden]